MRKTICILMALLLCMPAFAEAKPEWFSQYQDVFPLDCEPVRYLCEHWDSELWDLRDADGKLLQERYISGLADRKFRDGFAIAFSPDDMLYSSFINAQGELITGFKFGNGGWWGSRYFSDGLCCLTFANEGKYGCIDTEGNVVIEPIYDYLSNFSEGLAYFSLDQQYGYINTSGEIVVEVDTVSDLGGFHNGLSWIEPEQGLYGYINTRGEMAIPAIYRYAGNFSDGLAPVATADETMGWIRPDGSFAIEPEYLYAGEFQNGIAEAAVGAGYMEEGFSGDPTEKRLYGLIDTEGKPVLPLVYDDVELQRSANLDADEITATAWVGDIPHYFRILDGRAVEIAGLRREHEAQDWLQKAEPVAVKTRIEFDASHELPRFQYTRALCPLGEMLGAAAGYDPNIRIYEDRRYGSFADSYPEYGRILTDYADVKFGANPEAFGHDSDDFTITPVARDALVFMVAEDHPLDNLTMAELRSIYSGLITHWGELGAQAAGKITAYQHESIWTQLNFEALMRNILLMEPPMEYLESEYGDYANPCDFRALPGGIGFCMNSMLDASLRGEVKILSIDGKLPGEEGYPATVNIYAISDPGEDNPNVQALIDWVLSDQGQKLVEEAGYASIK